MRRIVVLFAVVALVGGLFLEPASASGVSARKATPARLHRAWIDWAFGSSGAPLLDPEFCGEQVGNVFFLTVAGGAPESVTRRLDCDIPADVPILVTPGGAIAWAPTDGETDRQLRRSLFNMLSELIVQSVHLSLDGEEIDHGPLEVPDPYTLALEPGNLIQTVDPNVTGDSTRIADGFYFKLIGPLDPGDHVLVASDKFNYTGAGEIVRYRTTFRLHVA
jgi:hypothetical protein